MTDNNNYYQKKSDNTICVLKSLMPNIAGDCLNFLVSVGEYYYIDKLFVSPFKK